MPGKNAPAYFASLSVARDMTLATGANVIKHFSSVTGVCPKQVFATKARAYPKMD